MVLVDGIKFSFPLASTKFFLSRMMVHVQILFPLGLNKVFFYPVGWFMCIVSNPVSPLFASTKFFSIQEDGSCGRAQLGSALLARRVGTQQPWTLPGEIQYGGTPKPLLQKNKYEA